MSEDRNSIPFGSSEGGAVCWTVEDGKRGIDKSGEYSKLFKDQWRANDADWNSSQNQGRWTQQCMESDISVQWATFGSNYGSGSQYLGLCEDVGIENTKFVKKTQNQLGDENSEEWTLWICNGECWASNKESSSSGAPRILQEKEGGSGWKKVKFYKG